MREDKDKMGKDKDKMRKKKTGHRIPGLKAWFCLFLCLVLGLTGKLSVLAEPEQSSDKDLCYISAYEIDEAIDGTEPFDADDERGNDSNGSNKIVRSFDSVNYTLKYTTAIRDSSITGVDLAYVMVDFSLPCDPSVASFNLDTMQWCLDRTVTYTYEDGSVSTTWNKDKTVVNQQVTGRRLLQNTEAGNTIPGTGTLSVGLQVKMAPNGQVLKPSFTIWMEGNPKEDKRTVSDTVTVSAAPKYDLAVSRNTSADILAYYNAESGQASSARKDASDMYGRLQGYAISLSLHNDTAEKGLKGIEIPQGTITFDLRMSETRNGEDVSYEPEYQPFFWDYRMNTGTAHKGTFGRDMTPLGQNIASYTTWQNNMPLNKRGNALSSCYDGGTMTIVSDETDANLLHVTLKDYAFDIENLQFPDRDSSDRAKTIADNIGYFSVGYVQTICRFPANVSEIENVVIGLSATNLKATALSGDIVTEDVVTTNNVRNATVTTYPKGSHSKRNFFYRSSGAQLAQPWNAGNAYAYAGQDVRLCGQMIYTGDSYLSGTNILQKFDDKVLEIPDGTSRYYSVSLSNSTSKLGTVTTLFAAKPDKTGWIDDTEMNNTREEQLLYFRSIDELHAAGYTCVGILYEVRDSQLLPDNGGGCISFQQIVHIKADTPSGTVTMTKNDVRSWNATNICDFSWTDVPYDDSIKAYGLGDPTWQSGTYTEGYNKPTYTTYTNYGKAVYENGTLVSGHTNGCQGGNSLLVISNKVGVGIQVNDQTESGRKSVYDLDAGERLATFSVTPTFTLDTANSDVSTSDIRDTVTVTVTLPKDLHWEGTGVSVTPESVEEQDDGTTIITWKFADVLVKDGLDPIVFTARIGEEGTVNDVVNNQSMTVSASITSVNDVRQVSAANGTYSETSISVIKLAASSVTKRALQTFVELGSDLGFRLRYSNLSDTSAEEAVLYDVLPYDGDDKGSNFHGSYVLSKVVVDYSHAPRTFAETKEKAALYVTDEESARGSSVYDQVLQHDFSVAGFTKQGGTVSDPKLIFDNLNLADPTAVSLYLNTVYGNEYIDVYLYLSPMDENGEWIESQMPGDVYGNRFYQNADNQAATVISNVVHSSVVDRQVSGRVWIDQNHNGVQDASESALPGVSVELWRTTVSQFQQGTSPFPVDDLWLYPGYDVFGNRVEAVKTDADGGYQFHHLEAGTYVVLVQDRGTYYVTVKDAGEDDTLDSDALDVDNLTYIRDIELPELANMTEALFSSEHHDIGLVRETHVSLQKTDANGDLLEGAELALYAADDVTDGVPKEGAKPICTWTSDSRPYQLDNVLLAGEQYTWIETKAPLGYLLADPITFTVEDTADLQTYTMMDAFRTSSITLKKYDTDGTTPLPGVEFSLRFVSCDGDPDGDFLLQEGETVTGVTDEQGCVTFEGLNRGTYEITETKTVKGHTLLTDPITVTLPLSFTEAELSEIGNVDRSQGVQIDDKWYFFDCTYEITNEGTLTMPMTGESPVRYPVYAGLGLLAVFCLLLVLRFRRRS